MVDTDEDILGGFEPYHGHWSSFENDPLIISHLEYIVDGVTYMRMKFHVSGSKRKGTVFMDLKKVRPRLDAGVCPLLPFSSPPLTCRMIEESMSVGSSMWSWSDIPQLPLYWRITDSMSCD